MAVSPNPLVQWNFGSIFVKLRHGDTYLEHFRLDFLGEPVPMASQHIEVVDPYAEPSVEPLFEILESSFRRGAVAVYVSRSVSDPSER